MTDIYVRILDVITNEKESGLNKLLVSIGTSRSRGEKVAIHNTKLLSKVWFLSTNDQAIDSLAITLEKRCVLSKNKELAKCVMPLDWFPTNKIVRDWFPLQRTSGKSESITTYILMDIHLENRKVSRFSVPFSNMRIIPSWNRPKANTVVLAPPQVILVAPTQGAGGNTEYVLVGSAQYPTVEQLQHPSGLTVAHVKKYSQGVNVPPILNFQQQSVAYQAPVAPTPAPAPSIYTPSVVIQTCPGF